ncbi:MAG: TetR/AcrR family transcriptional regulator [Candidatus Symbiothrix sp.]|jgi:AcrR family transcriptional regulator|nr:TetR/AcrR family transcriptional regulator [Candidatus Symbiothrix sp.]
MDLKERIVEEASPLFFKNGIRSITMSDIASDLGISKRTLYEVFRDKEELLKDVFSANMKCFDQKIEDLAKSSENVIEALMRIYALHLRSSQDFNRSLVHDLKKYYPTIYRQIQSKKQNGFQSFIPLMRTGVEQGLIREDTNFEVVTWLVKAQFKTLIDDEYIPTDKYSTNEFIQAIIINFIRGIATPLGHTHIDRIIKGIKQE